MPLRDSVAHDDAISTTKQSADTASGSASTEAWESIKNFVLNKTEGKTAPTVLIGDASWGAVNLSLTPNNAIEGTLEAGRASMHRSGTNEFVGDLPWGSTNLSFKNGQLVGQGPWGNIALKVDAQNISGDIPWGKVSLTLKGHELTGPTPWGTAHLRLGQNYKTLTNPDVLLALAAVMSDR